MTCNCGEKTFSFNFYKADGIYRIDKCARTNNDGKKKKRCDFYLETLLEKREIKYTTVDKEQFIPPIKKDHKKELLNYIHMCEKFGINENYSGNIVHLMNICGYRYIPCEKLSDLKKRLEFPKDKPMPDYKCIFPICLIELPDSLKPKTKTNKKKKKNYCEIISDDETDSEDDYSENSENDYQFDVEDNFSEEEIEDCDICYNSD